MICRSCGNEERASEGYPCAECGTFLCIMCNFRGVVLCKACAARAGGDGGAAESAAGEGGAQGGGGASGSGGDGGSGDASGAGGSATPGGSAGA